MNTVTVTISDLKQGLTLDWLVAKALNVEVTIPEIWKEDGILATAWSAKHTPDSPIAYTPSTTGDTALYIQDIWSVSTKKGLKHWVASVKGVSAKDEFLRTAICKCIVTSVLGLTAEVPEKYYDENKT